VYLVAISHAFSEWIVGAQVRWLWLTAGFDFDTRILHTSHIREFFTLLETHDQSTILAADATYYREEGMYYILCKFV
jgi:hypothetical protein